MCVRRCWHDCLLRFRRGRGGATPTSLRELLPEVEVVAENPFAFISPWTCYEVLKLLLLGPTLLPLRLAIAMLVALTAFVLALAITAGRPMRNDRGCFYHEQPFDGWRRNVTSVFAPLVRVALWCVGFWRIKIVDHRPADAAGRPFNVVVAAPHTTMVDQFLLYAAFPPLLCGVGDAAIAQAPIVGRAGAATQGVFVDLSSADSRDACREEIARRADPRRWEGYPTLVFPEGRITNGKQLIQFKVGAFAPGQPVLLVTLRFPFRYFNPAGQSRTNSRGRSWALRAMTQFYNRCEVHILEVLEPLSSASAGLEEGGRSDTAARNFANEARRRMARALGISTTEHSYDDAAFFRSAIRANVSADFEVRAVKNMFDIDMQELNGWLDLFRRADSNGDGRLDRREFARWLRRGPLRQSRRLCGGSVASRRPCCCLSCCCPRWLGGGERGWLAELFSILDTDDSGFIEFREFVQALGLVTGRCSSEAKIKLAFLLFDKGGSGVLSTDLQGVQDLLGEAAYPLREIDFAEFQRYAQGCPDIVSLAMQASSFHLPAPSRGRAS
eukprot:TRINITY_DN28952_c0_g1_i1.p1 TRINITY_DN28952_c0_g1~~TRINITY_DN28952_c0_g1_i1.p1  ORF type:complete len:556 (-),score=78.24 TRINITY_DN28952_c0_g1_i1:83-1750(-)